MMMPLMLALRRPLLVLPTAASRRCLRHMSSSSPSSASEDTELLSGLPLLMRTLWRCATRYSTLERWEREEIVPPTLSTWERHRLFLLLQTPGQLQFDADEFLVGAKHAIEQLLLTSKTREFSQFVAGDLASSAAAERLRSWCTPRGFTFHENAARLALERGMVVEAEHVEVTRVQLHECVYGQVSAAEFEDEVHGRRAVINEITPDATLERLFVSVKVTANERLRREYQGHDVQRVEQTNVYFAVLASDVTTPDVLDWGVVANVLANTLRSKELSRETIETATTKDQRNDQQKKTEAEADPK
ncbi:hypothetical protein PINS_up012764 [Pythium insidiosum]|nr:hypothetical protein PINS_up012764 [Pythium insidiosum]